MRLGSCRTAGYPDLWFPEKGGNPKAAQRICRECPVRIECLEHGLRCHEVHGVWGGKTPAELEEMRVRLGMLDG